MTTIENAISTFGENAQISKLCEECAELVTAVLHRRDHRDTNDHVAEEMADVTLMMVQMRIIFGISEEEIDKWMAYKLERLRERLENHD